MSKRLEIYEDASLPTGVAVFVISPRPDTEDGLSVVIDRRNSDRPFLGPHGWQAAEFGLVPFGTRPGSSGLELLFGSDITRHIDVSMDLIVTVPKLSIRERLFWPEISPAPDDKKAINLTWQNGKPSLQVRSEKVGEVGLERPDSQGASADETAGSVEPLENGATVPPNRSWLYMVVAAIGFLLCIAVFGAWYYLREQPPHGSVSQQPSTAVPAVEPTTTAPNFSDRYKALLNQAGHADELFALGNEALTAGENDTAFNAITLAADRGSANAKRLIAQWYDPLSADRKLVTANPNNAARYYREAGELGSAEAKTALKRLCDASSTSTPPAADWAAEFDKNTYCQ